MFRNPIIDAAVVLIVVLLIFGPKRLPLLGRSLGQGMREFKDSITGGSKDEEEERPALPEAAGTSASASVGAPTAATPEPAQTPPSAAAAPVPPAAAPATPERESAEVGSPDSRS